MKTASAESLSMDQSPAPVRLLLAEDSPEDLALIIDELSAPAFEYSHTHVKHRAQLEQEHLARLHVPEKTGPLCVAQQRTARSSMPA
jgi:hypothetical protein